MSENDEGLPATREVIAQLDSLVIRTLLAVLPSAGGQSPVSLEGEL